jgi:hypothetical protein
MNTAKKWKRLRNIFPLKKDHKVSLIISMQSEINLRKKTGYDIYIYVIKIWLVSILIFLPFQIQIATFFDQWSKKISRIIHNLDELTIIIFLLLSMGVYFKNRKALDKLFFFYSLLLYLVLVRWFPDLSMETLFL